MWDLHMHTTLSDGELSVQELCDYLKRENIKLFSITDHNHALVYEKELPTNIPYITGAELATSYKGKIIEVHAYQNKPSIINRWFQEFYSTDNLVKIEETLLERIKKIAKKEGLYYTQDIKLPEVQKGLSKKIMYQDLIKNNQSLFKEFPTYRSFFRQGLSNPQSQFFIDEGSVYPALQEVIDLIRQSGGKAILAHPYEYRFFNTMKELDILKKEVDGIESFHPSASYRQSLEIVDFCNENGLSTSGGSDFHRFDKRVRIGIRCYQGLFDAPSFNWLHEYISLAEFA